MHSEKLVTRDQVLEEAARAIEFLVLPRNGDERDPEDDLFLKFCGGGAAAIRALKSNVAVAGVTASAEITCAECSTTTKGGSMNSSKKLVKLVRPDAYTATGAIDGWIPVTERLPERADEYFVVIDGKYNSTGKPIVDRGYFDPQDKYVIFTHWKEIGMNNEPAFPAIAPNGEQFSGMTLRDYFAAKALNGWLASFAGTLEAPNKEKCAAFSYEMADAMLKERAK